MRGVGALLSWVLLGGCSSTLVTERDEGAGGAAAAVTSAGGSGGDACILPPSQTTVTVEPPEGVVLSCDSVHEITGTLRRDGDGYVVDTCPPGEDCAPTLYRLSFPESESSPLLDGLFVNVSMRMCEGASSVALYNAPTLDGRYNDLLSDSRLLVFVTSGPGWMGYEGGRPPYGFRLEPACDLSPASTLDDVVVEFYGHEIEIRARPGETGSGEVPYPEGPLSYSVVNRGCVTAEGIAARQMFGVYRLVP